METRTDINALRSVTAVRLDYVRKYRKNECTTAQLEDVYVQRAISLAQQIYPNPGEDNEEYYSYLDKLCDRALEYSDRIAVSIREHCIAFLTELAKEVPNLGDVIKDFKRHTDTEAGSAPLEYEWFARYGVYDVDMPDYYTYSPAKLAADLYRYNNRHSYRYR